MHACERVCKRELLSRINVNLRFKVVQVWRDRITDECSGFNKGAFDLQYQSPFTRDREARMMWSCSPT